MSREPRRSNFATERTERAEPCNYTPKAPNAQQRRNLPPCRPSERESNTPNGKRTRHNAPKTPHKPRERQRRTASTLMRSRTAQARHTPTESPRTHGAPTAFANPHFRRYLFIKVFGLYIFLYFSLLTFFSFLYEVGALFRTFYEVGSRPRRIRKP